MSQYGGFCKKHKILVFDYCRLCEADVHRLVVAYTEEHSN
jgi:hypothetical protein